MDDFELLDDYARTGSHAAFDTLVKRHSGWLYASARRRVGSPDLADDVTQAVFIVLARKARTIRRKHSLAAWLHQVGKYAATDALRRRGVRQRHERAAARPEAAPPAASDPAHAAYLPHLDQALDSLPTRDREAVVLRYYTGQTLEQIGQAQRVAASTVQRRLERSLARVGLELKCHGRLVSGTTLAAALAATGTAAAPSSATAGITALATAAPALPASAAGPIGLAKGTMHMMTVMKMKLVAAAVAGAVTIGAGGFAIERAVAQHDMQMKQFPVPGASDGTQAKSSSSAGPSTPIVLPKFDLNGHGTAQWTNTQFNMVHYNAVAAEAGDTPVDSQTLEIQVELRLNDVGHILGFNRSMNWLSAADADGNIISELHARTQDSNRSYEPLDYGYITNRLTGKSTYSLQPRRFTLSSAFKAPIGATLASINARTYVLTYDHLENIDIPFTPNGPWTDVLPGVRAQFKRAEVIGQSYQYQLVSQVTGRPLRFGEVSDKQPLPERVIAARFMVDAAGKPMDEQQTHPMGSFPSFGGGEMGSGSFSPKTWTPAAMRIQIAVGLKEQEVPITLTNVVLPALPTVEK